MKVLLVALNSKYIHPNLAVRYLAANTDYETEIREFTIKDQNDNIIEFVNEGNYDLVGFSCYIWNIEKIKEILPEIKAGHVLLGGPEVSFNGDYYIREGLAEYVIKNEGEEAFDMLLKYLDGKAALEDVPNLYYKGGYTFDAYADISSLKLPYDLYGDLTHKIAYIETSRGCPFRCAYCMAGIDNNLRFFDFEKITEQIGRLQKSGARVFKFLDRTFNANPKFIELIDYIVENHREGESYQFEITGDILKEEFIEHINKKAPEKLIRFEIGIQSTNPESNLAVGRHQNNERLFKNIRMIQQAGVIDLHLDLIAGLPKEDYRSFVKTFNDCVSLRPKELQLGFLKMLRGTSLYEKASLLGYVFPNKAPYEIISGGSLSADDLAEIHFTENAFDRYYNGGLMKTAINTVLDNEPNPFMFFNALGHALPEKPVVGLDNQFRLIDDFVKNKPYYKDFHTAAVYDYMNRFNVKPLHWWQESVTRKELRENYEEICGLDPTISLSDCVRYGLLAVLGDIRILGIYKPGDKKIQVITKMFICK